MKPELRYGKKDIRYCHYCVYWDANVYELDARGRKRLIHEGTGCVFGTDNCPFKEDPEPFPPIEPKYKCCKDCPYGVGKACIGWCTRKVLGQMEGDPDGI
jgi:hypothetical protein